MNMSWLQSYSTAAAATDNFKDRDNHLLLLASGLMGEAGSVLAEMKKMSREEEAYPVYRHRLNEEVGDFLWYYVRLISLTKPTLLDDLASTREEKREQSFGIERSLALGASVGRVLGLLQQGNYSEIGHALQVIWLILSDVAGSMNISLEEVAKDNLVKITSRWPSQKVFHQLFDEGCVIEEQIPRNLTLEFVERKRGGRIEVLLRYRQVSIGDRLTDNIADPDGYRYHDIFHIAYAVFLGWSPVVRTLFRCKRKSNSAVDENQDGARPAILEEAVAAIVFSRAKRMRFFEGAKSIDYDLLKNIGEFVQGYEVDQIPLWQWETAILEGFRVFRLLRSTPGGKVTWDLVSHKLEWEALKG
jgi:NTP pyrophosphatase (non-canonical NTP hydrolase)